MPDSFLIPLALNCLLNALVSGVAGAALATRLGVRRGTVVTFAVLVPWIGLLAAPVVARGRGASPPRPARGGAALGAVVLGVLGVGLLAGSLTSEWASVSGSVHEFAQSYSGRLGDTSVGVVTVGGLCIAFLGLLAGAVARGGFRFAIPLAWLSCGAALTVFDAAIGSSLLSGVVEHLTSISGGHASAGFWVGVGARLALGGSIAVLLASICLIWHARVAVNSTGGQPGMPAAVRPTPAAMVTPSWDAVATGDPWAAQTASWPAGSAPVPPPVTLPRPSAPMAPAPPRPPSPAWPPSQNAPDGW